MFNISMTIKILYNKIEAINEQVRVYERIQYFSVNCLHCKNVVHQTPSNTLKVSNTPKSISIG